MVIRQGDIYWVDLGPSIGSEPGFIRPCVIVQNDHFNQSRIRTAVICILTSNLDRANSPGNLLLEAGEAGLPKRSVVNVSQLYTVDRGAIQEYIGTLSIKRTKRVVDGICFMLNPV